jgi:hypothetical protein
MNSIVPVYSFPFNNNNNNNNTARENGPAFSARPLKHWRKQLQSNQPARGFSAASVGILQDKPGSYTRVATTEIHCQACNNAYPFKIGNINLDTETSCVNCQGTGTAVANRRTTAIQIQPNTTLSEKMYNTTASYLKSRCLTYVQHETCLQAPDTVLFNADGIVTQPTDSSDGPQVRTTLNCVNVPVPVSVLVPVPVWCTKTIYKPNNMQYAQQGGVSASSRLARLKYNTLNHNGAVFTSAAGAVNTNSGRYQTEPSPGYVVKYKPQASVFPHKTGAKNTCQNYMVC